jgi:hypothetical protein
MQCIKRSLAGSRKDGTGQKNGSAANGLHLRSSHDLYFTCSLQVESQLGVEQAVKTAKTSGSRHAVAQRAGVPTILASGERITSGQD